MVKINMVNENGSGGFRTLAYAQAGWLRMLNCNSSMSCWCRCRCRCDAVVVVVVIIIIVAAAVVVVALEAPRVRLV